MVGNLRELGYVKLIQVQPSGSIINYVTEYIFDPSRHVEIDQLRITHQGKEANTPGGKNVLDIHHRSHPNTRSEGDNVISIGFTSH